MWGRGVYGELNDWLTGWLFCWLIGKYDLKSLIYLFKWHWKRSCMIWSMFFKTGNVRFMGDNAICKHCVKYFTKIISYFFFYNYYWNLIHALAYSWYMYIFCIDRMVPRDEWMPNNCSGHESQPVKQANFFFNFLQTKFLTIPFFLLFIFLI